MKTKFYLIAFCFIGLFQGSLSAGNAETINLNISALADGKHEYFYDLLLQSLSEAGHDVTIVLSLPISQPNIAKRMKEGSISLRWYLEAKKHEERYTPVNVYLTNGLIGKRVLVVKKGDIALYSSVHTLDHFRKLKKVAALGEDWFDIDVWQHNQLPFKVQKGEWRYIFPLFSYEHKEFDYFPRSIIEVNDEIRFFPDVAIEPTLLFVYKNDFKFYLSHTAKHYKPFLEQALQKARESGLMDRLIEQHWGFDMRSLKLDKRTMILLESP